MKQQEQAQSREIFKPKECTDSSEDQNYVYKIKTYKAQTLSQKISYMIIRPPRFLYNEQLLIPSTRFQGKFSYEEVHIPFPLSIYLPQQEQMKYIILYLHGNTSSRFQGYTHLVHLPNGVGLACFDFNGCGHRKQADFITLGQKQSQQVDIAAKYLKKKGFKVVGWGRSMGSVSLLMSHQCDVMIADSPFTSLDDICKQTGKKIVPSFLCGFFYCFYPCVECWLKSQIQKLAGLNVNQLKVIDKVRQLPQNKSILFLAGSQDNMIDPNHSQKIYDAFKGAKKILIFEGTHNSNRPKSILKQCFQFINQRLKIEMNLQNYEKLINIKQIRQITSIDKKVEDFIELKQNTKISIINSEMVKSDQYNPHHTSQKEDVNDSSHRFILNQQKVAQNEKHLKQNVEKPFFYNRSGNQKTLQLNQQTYEKIQEQKNVQKVAESQLQFEVISRH